MNEATIDQIIADKKTEVAEAAKPAAKTAPAAAEPVKAAPAPVKAAPAATPAEGEDAPAGDEGAAEDAAAGEGDESRTPWPKTAVNAMARRDRKLNQLRARDADRESKLSDAAFLEQRLADLKGGKKPAGTAPQVDPNDPEPEITKYDDWDKYQNDLRAWDKRQVTREVKGSLTETTKTEQAEAQIAAHVDKARAKADEVIATNPEFLDIVQQNADVIDAFPAHVQHALLKADNATLAVVVLANEGILEDLAEMSPALAEKTITAAQARGMALIAKSEGSEGAEPAEVKTPAQPAKKVSQAPAPMKAAKTVTQSGTKRAKDMNDKEFRKEFAV